MPGLVCCYQKEYEVVGPPVSANQSSHHPHPTIEENSIAAHLESNVDQQPQSLILHKSELREPKSSTSFSLKRKSRSRTRKNNNNNNNNNSSIRAKTTKK
eukprot:TCALIF_02121-PA protein Name:"Protein of unknown function" AED:0.49 eAED:0.49 QI:0/0/0/0.5/1/1/2/0/99